MSSRDLMATERWRQWSDFPAGLRVLVVDGDVACLKAIESMLKKCSFEVTATTKGKEALEMLQKNNNDYDVVLCDATLSDMDGFELLRTIVLRGTDIPVVMTSVNNERSSVMECVRQGARDHLGKPLCLSVLKNIWQHVFRKVVVETSKIDCITARGEIRKNRPLGSLRQSDNSRANMEGQETIIHPSVRDSHPCKKPRFSWTKDLKTKFANVVHELGIDSATPKPILEKMNEPELTRAIVASHLQKLRNSFKENANKSQKKDTDAHSKRLQSVDSAVPSYPLNPCHRGLPQQSVQPREMMNPAWVASHPHRSDNNSQAFHPRERMSVDYTKGSSQFGNLTGFGNIPKLGPIPHGLVAENASQGSLPFIGHTPYAGSHPGSFNHRGRHMFNDGSSFNRHSGTHVLRDGSSLNHQIGTRVLKYDLSQPFHTRQPDSTIETLESFLPGSLGSDSSEQSFQLTHTNLPTENRGGLDNDHDPFGDLDDIVRGATIKIRFEDQ